MCVCVCECMCDFLTSQCELPHCSQHSSLVPGHRHTGPRSGRQPSWWQKHTHICITHAIIMRRLKAVKVMLSFLDKTQVFEWSTQLVAGLKHQEAVSLCFVADGDQSNAHSISGSLLPPLKYLCIYGRKVPLIYETYSPRESSFCKKHTIYKCNIKEKRQVSHTCIKLNVFHLSIAIWFRISGNDHFLHHNF